MTTVNTPKLLNLSTHIVRNQRTLIWLQNQNNNVNWSKWDAVVSSIESFNYWTKYKAKIVGIIITETSNNNFFTELHNISKKVPLILLSQNILNLKSQEYWSNNFDNILNLDNIVEQYPFIQENWNNTIDDAIAIFSILCRYNKIIDSTNTRPLSMPSNISFNSNSKPNETWVFTQFFKHNDFKRFQEIKECLRQNCQNTNIDKIVLINEKDYSDEFKQIPGSKKIQQIISQKRLTYGDFLKYVKEKVPTNIFTILCNSDIFFKDSLLDLHKINMSDKMLGLLRWDVGPDGNTQIFGPRADSQDSWIFLSDSIKSRNWDFSKLNFQLGQAGCDNAFAGHILRQRFLISNPALTFKTFHLHNTNIRNYDKKDFIRSDIYINLAPTYIIDSKQEIVPLGTPNMLSNELVSFEIKSSSMSNEITYCTMLEKEGRYKWEPTVENHYFEPAIPLYKWNKCSVTPNGLVYDLFNIYKGKYADDDKFNYWETANVDILTPLQKCDKMFAIPLKNTDIFKHPDTYILNYISRCTRLLKQYPGTSFWIPPQFTEYIQYFDWSKEQPNTILFDENTGCYANEIIGFLPCPQMLELGSEDIQALREIYPSWIEKPTGKICSIVIGQQITEEFAENKIRNILSDEWSIKYVHASDYVSYDSLIGSSLCIFIGGSKTQNIWSKLWALPKECCVIEFQQELKINGEFQHLAHISEFKSWVLLLSKGIDKDVQEQIFEQFEKWFKKNKDLII